MTFDSIIVQVVTFLGSFWVAVGAILMTDSRRRNSARANALAVLTARLEHDQFDRPKSAPAKPGEVLFTIPASTAYCEWVVQSGVLDDKHDRQLIVRILELLGWIYLHREYVRVANLKLFFKPQYSEAQMDSLTLSATDAMFKTGYELYTMLTQKERR